MLSQIFFMENLLYLDRENRTVLWNDVLLLKSIIHPISNKGNWQLNQIPLFSYPYESVLFIDKGYNSAVECHLDVVEVIGSNLIIPKPIGIQKFQRVFFYFDDGIESKWRMEKRLVGLTWGGAALYNISGRQLRTNMTWILVIKWKNIPNQLCLLTRKL